MIKACKQDMFSIININTLESEFYNISSECRKRILNKYKKIEIIKSRKHNRFLLTSVLQSYFELYEEASERRLQILKKIKIFKM